MKLTAFPSDRVKRIWELQSQLMELKHAEDIDHKSRQRKERLELWLAGRGDDTLEPKS